MKIGLQLYSIRNNINGDIRYALKQAAEAGYDGVEFAGFGGLTPEEIREELKKNGLIGAGAHIGMEPFRANCDEAVKNALTMGLETVCVPCANVDPSYEGWVSFAKEMNEIGKKFRKEGILFGYHNHTHEFTKYNGKYAIEILLENSDSENVFWEMDTMWAHKGGENPEEFIKKYAGRAFVLHAKDEAADGDDTEAGTGIFNFPEIAKNAKASWLVVEQEKFIIDPLESIKISAKTLKSQFEK